MACSKCFYGGVCFQCSISSFVDGPKQSAILMKLLLPFLHNGEQFKVTNCSDSSSGAYFILCGEYRSKRESFY